MPQQRRKPIKVQEIDDCLEKMKSLEKNVLEEDFQLVQQLKESLQVMKDKWVELKNDLKNVSQDKNTYHEELEKSTKHIVHMNEQMNQEKNLYLTQIKNLEGDLLEQKLFSKGLDETFTKQKDIFLKKMEDKDVEISNLVEKLEGCVIEKNRLEEELDILKEKEKLLETQEENIKKKENEISVIMGELKSCDEKRKRVEKEMEDLKIEGMKKRDELEKEIYILKEKMDRNDRDKEDRIKILQVKLSSSEIENENSFRNMRDHIDVLVVQKKHLAVMVDDLKRRLDKKSKCCIL
jgi:hypothetical protein